jgi:hypothetical protein
MNHRARLAGDVVDHEHAVAAADVDELQQLRDRQLSEVAFERLRAALRFGGHRAHAHCGSVSPRVGRDVRCG